jgi:hypothetical protein
MDQVFPLGFPPATAFYLALFVLTLVVHVLFMNYVLAGTAYLLWYRVWTSLGSKPIVPSQQSPTASKLPAKQFPPTVGGVLCDWLPAMLSGAITAGVAPLLFLQILYQREFYTANLLLFNRWMIILPVLIVGFYGLYLVRGNWFDRRSTPLRLLLAALPLLCVAFIAYSWTENHLLSMQSTDVWRSLYVRQPFFYYESRLVPRLMVWAFGSLPTLAMWLGWQLWYRQRRHSDVPPVQTQHVARLAQVGLVLAAVGAGWYYSVADEVTRNALISPAARPYSILAAVGFVLSTVAWLWQWKLSTLDARPLSTATVGLVITVLGASVCREVVRLAAIGPDRLAELLPSHQAATRVDGFSAFLIFALLNSALIALCFWLVRKGLRRNELGVRPKS